MKVIESAAELKAARVGWGRPVGLVPTMGYLHQGHLSLVERARAECQTAVLSIFVNPTQFGPHEDFERYPRDVPRDLRLCEEAGVDVVFTPPAAEMYSEGYRTYVEVEQLAGRWEGAARPRHFRGVATVVTLLFRMASPDRAYFGEKDYQQLQVVRRLSRDLHLDVEVVGCPTIREPDGLACSSRNIHLAGEDRQRASILHAALCAGQERLGQGERRASALLAAMKALLAGTPSLDLDYVAIVDPATLEPVDRVDAEARALIAAQLGGVHLIDNLALIPPLS